MAMTKADLLDRIIEDLERLVLTKSQTSEVFETILEVIKGTLESGDKVKISGFGNFTPVDKRARIGRNPKTGEAQKIEARRVVTFKPSPVLKERMNQL